VTARSWLAAAWLLSWLLVGCPSDESEGETGSDMGMAQVGPADPTGDAKEDPTSPGLEPPVTTDPTDAQGGSSGSGSSAGGSGAGNPPVQPPTTMEPDPDLDAGTGPSCATAANGTCGASSPCAEASLHCIVVPECAGPV
jgi:hypothetical protein